MALHILSSLAPAKLHLLQQSMADHDTLLLVGDGVYRLTQIPTQQRCYVRQEDLRLRGLENSHATAIAIDNERWVALTLEHSPIISWHD